MALEENNTNPIDAYETSGTSPTTGSASATDSPEQLDAFKQSGTSPTEPFDDNGVTNCTDSYSDFEAEDETYDLDSHDAKSEGLIEDVLPRPSQPEPKLLEPSRQLSPVLQAPRIFNAPIPGLFLTKTEADDDPHRLATLFIYQHYLYMFDCGLFFYRGEFWCWDGRRYIPLSRQQLRAEVTRAVKDEFNRIAKTQNPPHRPAQVRSGLVSNVINAIGSIVLVPESEELPLWIGPLGGGRPYFSMANGLLDTLALLDHQGNELKPHSPRWFSRNAFPYDYDPQSGCPLWLEFLEEVLERDGERIRLIQEWFGYCLTWDTSQHKFMVLEGEGANGKGVVCEVLTALLGRDNVSNVPLEIFGERFQLTPTLGKLANIASEIGDIKRVAEGQLKQFISGDRMYFDRKGILGVEAYPTARLLFSTNQRPRFSDRSSGLWRRMILVPFRVTIPEERQDKLLVQRLKNELPGIFLWAVEGLRRLSLNGQFTEPAVCKEALDQYKIENNPCREFLEDHYEYDATAVTKTQDAYGNYTQWARSRGVEVLSDTEFGKEVCRAFAQVTKKKRGGRKARYSEYIGLKARPLYDFAENALGIGGELRVERLVGPPVGPFPRPPQDTEQQDVDDE